MENAISVKSAIVTHPAGWDLGFHRHDGLEISAVLQGRGLFTYDDQSFLLEPGHVVLIPSGLPHRYQGTTDIRFAVIEAANVLPACAGLFARLVPEYTPQIFMLSKLDIEQYESLFRHFLIVSSQDLRERDLYLNTWLELFLLFVMQHASSNPKSFSVAEAADYIRTHLNEHVQMKELAAMAGLSESGFRIVFKNVYGVSPKQYQQRYRMSEAKWLLRSTENPIQRIAEHVGFSTLHAFSAWFQRSEGVSPLSWRKRQRLHADSGEWLSLIYPQNY